MTSFFSALLLAAISGLCFLAVQYPKIYRDQIYGKLNVAAIVVNALFTAYSVGVTKGMGVLLPLIPSDKYSIYLDISKNANIPYLWIVLGFTGFLVFLVILLWLSYLIEKERSKRPDAA